MGQLNPVFLGPDGNERKGRVDADGKLIITGSVTTGQLLPVEGLNASLVIENTDMVEASTQTITKIIGSTSYTKVLSKNAAGDVIAVSAWTEV